MHVENAAVVHRLVHLIAIQMMTVRFRSVAPINNARSDELLFLLLVNLKLNLVSAITQKILEHRISRIVLLS